MENRTEWQGERQIGSRPIQFGREPHNFIKEYRKRRRQ